MSGTAILISVVIVVYYVYQSHDNPLSVYDDVFFIVH